MFLARLRPDLDLRLLEERHAAPVFALVDRDRAVFERIDDADRRIERTLAERTKLTERILKDE